MKKFEQTTLDLSAYEKVYENAPFGCVILHVYQNSSNEDVIEYFFANQAFSDFIGLPLKDIIGKTHKEIFADKFNNQESVYLDIAKNGTHFVSLESHFVNGKFFNIEGWRIIEGYCSISFTEITYQFENEMKERERQQIEKSLFQTTPGGSGIFTFREDYLESEFFSDGFARLSGSSCTEIRRLIDNHTLLKEIIIPDDYDSVIQKIKEKTTKGEDLNLTYRFFHKDGTVKWLHLEGKKLREKDGFPVYYCVFSSPSDEAALFKNIVEGSDNGIVIAELKNKHVIYANKKIEFFYGGSVKHDSIFGSGVDYINSHGSRPFLTNEQIENLKEDHFTEFHVLRNGMNVFIKGKGLQWSGKDAYILYLIDETKEHESQQKLQNIMNLIPTGVAEYCVKGDQIEQNFINNGFFRTHNITKEEYDAAGESSALKGVFPEDTHLILEAIDYLKKGNDTCDIIYRYKFPNKPIGWVRLKGTVDNRIDDGFHVYAGYSNVTSQIVASQRLNNLFNTIPSGIVEFYLSDDKLKMTSYNQRFLEMVGLSSDQVDLFGMIEPGDWIHHDDLAKMDICQRKGNTEERYSYDFRLLNSKTNLYRWISCDLRVTDEDDNGITVLAALLDIDDKRKAESASEAKSQFLSRMSHDIRTPMNGIIGMTRLTQDIPGLPEEAQKNLSYISDSSDFLLGLINDTLEMSRIESGKIELHPEVIRADKLISNVQTTIMTQANKKNIKIDFVPVNAELEYIKVDKLRVQQIFMNVLSNAVKFSHENGYIRVVIECLKRENGIAYDKITVEDHGIGMSKEFLKHIYEPFSQENHYSGTGMVGTGLGMSIVKQIVGLMNGKIDIESEKGVGTTVTAYLNFERVYDYHDTEEEEHKVSDEILRGKHILLTEDHPLNTKIAIKLLEKKGMIVTHAENGQVAVDKFDASPVGFFDAIMMDIRMPIMDGLTSAKTIRRLARKDAKIIPIIAVTANAYDTDIRSSKEAGMNTHLSKPLEPDVMYKTLAQYISSYREKGK
ncbi:MAG: ATP-binding protein [Bacilli bacterium]